ncbi:MAG: diguanylate cyclase [Candidatus Obscuribacterales bacterium]
MFRKTGISGQFQNNPELPALHQLLSQALENRGKQMQIVWKTPYGAIFTLIVLCNLRGDPRWCLYCEQKGKRDLLFDYNSCDVILVNNLITSSVTEAQKTGRSPFAAGQKLSAKPPESDVIQNFNPEPPAEIEASPAKPESTSKSTSQPTPPTSFQPAAAPQEMPFANPTPYTPPSVVPTRSPSLLLCPRNIDGEAIQNVMTSLRNQHTGMFMTPAFLYFLEQEYFRNLRSRSSLSVIVFDLREESPEDGNMVRKILPAAALVEAVVRITALKRHVDILAHYDDESYALLLPHTKSAGAKTLANRLIRSLTDRPLANVEPSRLAISIGCASIPEDFVDLPKLLGATDLTLSHAKKTRTRLVMYSDIRNSVTVNQ